MPYRVRYTMPPSESWSSPNPVVEMGSPEAAQWAVVWLRKSRILDPWRAASECLVAWEGAEC